MIVRLLITTFNKKVPVNPKNNQTYLGHWCIPYNKNSKNFSRSKDIIDYHWNDRNKLYQDYLFLNKVHIAVIKQLTKKLNNLHNEEKSEKYWEIIVGPWLYNFTPIIFDRWTMLKKALSDRKITHVMINKNLRSDHVDNSYVEFDQLNGTDEWNSLIYEDILKFLLINKNITGIKLINKFNRKKKKNKISYKTRFKNLIKFLIGKLSSVLCRDKDVFIIDTYLGFKINNLIQLFLLQIPVMWFVPVLEEFKYKRNIRNWQIFISNQFSKENEEFLSLLSFMISKHLPKSYLEGYQKVKLSFNLLGWPKTPKAVFTSNAHITHDFFKIWLAEKMEKGATLFIGQHGGGPSTSKIHADEIHEKSISDYYLTWSKTNKEESNIIGQGILNDLVYKKIKSKNNGSLLIIGLNLKSYSTRLWSAPISCYQYNNYLKDLGIFLDTLPIEIKEKVILRFYKKQFDKFQINRLYDTFPNLNIEDTNKSLESKLKLSRICICTYNGTTMLQTLALNYPTLIFWNPDHHEIRLDALPFYKELKRVKILFFSQKEMETHLLEIWEDVQLWWENKDLQKARSEFCDSYAYRNKNITKELIKILRNKIN